MGFELKFGSCIKSVDFYLRYVKLISHGKK